MTNKPATQPWSNSPGVWAFECKRAATTTPEEATAKGTGRIPNKDPSKDCSPHPQSKPKRKRQAVTAVKAPIPIAWADTLVRDSRANAHNTKPKEANNGRVNQGLRFKSAVIHHNPKRQIACTT